MADSIFTRARSFVAGLLRRATGRRDPAAILRADREFLPATEEIASTPPAPAHVAVASSICALFAIGLLMAWFGKVDIYAVAPGRIQPVGRSKVIQPLSVGKVRAIYVTSGARVRKGDLLVELDSTEATADRQTLMRRRAELSLEIARRNLAVRLVKAGQYSSSAAWPRIEGATPDLYARETAVLAADLAQVRSAVELLRSRIAGDQAQKNALQSTIAAQRNVLQTMNKRVQIRRDLQSQGWESMTSVLDATEAYEKAQVSQVTSEGQLAQIDAEIRTLRSQILQTTSQFITENTGAIQKAESDLGRLSQEFVKTSARLDYTRLSAPIDGTVQQLAITTVGQVVNTGQQLMTIVPQNGALEIEALVPNQDVGFVRVGQPVVVKVDAFPFTRYGTLKGRVTSISRDAVSSEEAQASSNTEQQPISASASGAAATPRTQHLVYSVRILIDQTAMTIDGQNVKLSPGMSIVAEIRTGHRRVLDYLLSPLVKVASESLHER